MEGIAPIPATAVYQYCDRYAAPEWTVDAILAVDRQYREAVRANHGN